MLYYYKITVNFISYFSSGLNKVEYKTVMENIEMEDSLTNTV